MNPLDHAFKKLVFKENPTGKDLMTIILTLGIFWAVLFGVSIRLGTHYLKKQPWFRSVSDSDYERIGKHMMEKIGVQETKEQYYHRFAFSWPWWWCVCLQHFTGGALCLPAILGIGDGSTASSLACLGILSEVAWELSDVLMWLHRRYFTDNGKHKAPGGLLCVLFIHHGLGCFLGIPMILYYRNLASLHWLCFELQAAAGVAGIVQQITKLLDVSDPRQHRLFLQLSGFSLLTMIVTRLIHWPVLVGQIFMVWYQEQAWGFMAVALPICVLFSIFSWAFCISPGASRMIKFWNMQVPKSSVDRRRSGAKAISDGDAHGRRRRSSFIKSLQGSCLGVDMALKLD